MKQLLTLLILSTFAVAVSAADTQSGFYEHPITGTAQGYTAQIAVSPLAGQPGKVTVKITVNGKTTTSTGVAGAAEGSISSMDPVEVNGGHTIKIVKGKSKPRSKKKGQAAYKVMKKLTPAGGRVPSAAFESGGASASAATGADSGSSETVAGLRGDVTGADSDEGIGTLPSTVAPTSFSSRAASGAKVHVPSVAGLDYPGPQAPPRIDDFPLPAI